MTNVTTKSTTAHPKFQEHDGVTFKDEDHEHMPFNNMQKYHKRHGSFSR